MRHGTIASAVLFLVASGITRADPPAKLVKPKGRPEKQAWKGREVIRNGDFTGRRTSWLISGIQKGTREESGRSKTKGDYGAYFDNDRDAVSNALLSQTLNLPGKVTSARLSLNWAVFNDTETASLEQFSIAIGTAGANGLDAAATPVLITAKTAPGNTWQLVDHTFTAAELKKLNGFIAKGQSIALLAVLTGKGMVAFADNVSLVVDCEFTLPEPPGLLAFTERTDKGESLIVSTADGSARETVFTGTGRSDIRGLDWRVDGKAICFVSDHELGASWWNYDVYELGEAGLRRVTNGPSLAEIKAAAAPAGTVTVRVRNTTDKKVNGIVYVQGGVNMGVYSLGPKGSATESVELTIDGVSDLGDKKQYVCWRDGSRSDIALSGVDVQAGKTVPFAAEILVASNFPSRTLSQPRYSHDAARIFYEMGAIRSVDTKTGVFGEALPRSERSWDPAGSPVDGRVLYVQFDRGVCLYDPATMKSESIVPHPGSAMHHPAWVANGSGFVYLSATESPLGHTGTNVIFHAIEEKLTLPLTDVYNERLSSPAISPDSAWIAVVRSPDRELMDAGVGRAELWVMKVGEPHIAWQIETRGIPGDVSWTK